MVRQDTSLDVRLFRYALAAAEHGSFRRAAAILNVQQSSVSRGVRSLEHRVGADLFERSRAGIRPTRAGDRFLQEAALGFEHLTRAIQRVAAIQRVEHGDLVVCVSIPLDLLDGAIERFRRDHGGVAIEFVETTSREARALIERRKVDVAFVGSAWMDGTAQFLYLREEPMIVALPRSHPLATASELSLADLRFERLLVSSFGMGPEVEEYVVEHSATGEFELSVKVQRVNQRGLVSLVAMGLGVTIAVGRPRETPKEVALVPLFGSDRLSLHAVWMDANPNPALRALLDVLGQV